MSDITSTHFVNQYRTSAMEQWRTISSHDTEHMAKKEVEGWLKEPASLQSALTVVPKNRTYHFRTVKISQYVVDNYYSLVL